MTITSEERAALIEVRDGLASGKLKHTDYDKPTAARGFNMTLAYNADDCGTVACIGGWMAAVLHTNSQTLQYARITEAKGDTIYSYVTDTRSPSLEALFFPPPGVPFETITPEQAVKAIDHFLVDENPRWKEVCA